MLRYLIKQLGPVGLTVVYKRLVDGRNWAGFRFALFLIIFSLVLASAIYFREVQLQADISYVRVIAWQLIIWMPLTLLIPLLNYLAYKTTIFYRPSKWLILTLLGMVLMTMHFGWFYQISSTISPYAGVPKTKFGVFPFFFIFWVLVDMVMLYGLTLYYDLKIKAQAASSIRKGPLTLSVKRGNTTHVLSMDDIYWISAEDYCIKYYSSRGKFLERRTLKSIMNLLPTDKFIQIHRSTVVNISAISALNITSGQKAKIVLKDGNQRPVSRAKLKEVKQIISQLSFN